MKAKRAFIRPVLHGQAIPKSGVDDEIPLNELGHPEISAEYPPFSGVPAEPMAEEAVMRPKSGPGFAQI
jgi:hypothetical protein